MCVRFFLICVALLFAFAKQKMIIVHELDELSAWHICMCNGKRAIEQAAVFNWQTMQNEMKEKQNLKYTNQIITNRQTYET